MMHGKCSASQLSASRSNHGEDNRQALRQHTEDGGQKKVEILSWNLNQAKSYFTVVIVYPRPPLFSSHRCHRQNLRWTLTSKFSSIQTLSKINDAISDEVPMSVSCCWLCSLWPTREVPLYICRICEQKGLCHPCVLCTRSIGGPVGKYLFIWPIPEHVILKAALNENQKVISHFQSDVRLSPSQKEEETYFQVWKKLSQDEFGKLQWVLLSSCRLDLPVSQPQKMNQVTSGTSRNWRPQLDCQHTQTEQMLRQ